MRMKHVNACGEPGMVLNTEQVLSECPPAHACSYVASPRYLNWKNRKETKFGSFLAGSKAAHPWTGVREEQCRLIFGFSFRKFHLVFDLNVFGLLIFKSP